eukprot:scaffold76852_cov34-Prasinocladus_malaysianus.AAC.1
MAYELAICSGVQPLHTNFDSHLPGQRFIWSREQTWILTDLSLTALGRLLRVAIFHRCSYERVSREDKPKVSSPFAACDMTRAQILAVNSIEVAHAFGTDVAAAAFAGVPFGDPSRGRMQLSHGHEVFPMSRRPNRLQRKIVSTVF